MYKWLLVFLITFILDFIWTIYIDSINKRYAIKAGISSMLITVLGALAIIQYVKDNSLLVAVGLGAFFGTTISTKWGLDKKN